MQVDNVRLFIRSGNFIYSFDANLRRAVKKQPPEPIAQYSHKTA